MKKRNLASKIMTTGLAAAMVFSMSVPAFADYAETPETATTANTFTGTTIPVKKTLTTNKGTTLDATFEYTVTSDSNNPTGAPSITIPDIEVKKTDTTTDTATETKDMTLPTADKFSSAGTYVYTIKETEGDANFVFTDDKTEDKMTYDTNEYKMRIFVGYGESDKLEIKGVTVENKKDGKKVSSTDGIQFENKYWKDGGSGSQTTPGDKDTAFTLSKTIDGQNRQADDQFDFTVTFTLPSVLPDSYAGPTSATANTANKVVAATVNGSGTTYTATVTLKGGEKAVFNNVPAGTTYAVTETAKDGNKATYTASYKINGADATNTAPTTQLISEDTNTCEVINKTADITMTGIVNQYGGLIAIVAIAVAGGVLVIMRRRRYDA